MDETHMYLMLMLNIVGFVLFFYVLYLIGGFSHHVKKILEKVEQLEKKGG